MASHFLPRAAFPSNSKICSSRSTCPSGQPRLRPADGRRSTCPSGQPRSCPSLTRASAACTRRARPAQSAIPCGPVGRREPMPEEQAIVARAATGDRRAFEQIYRAYAPTLFSYVLVPMLGDRDDAHDCLRETFLAAYRHLATFTWHEGGLYPWLKTLAKNKARDLLRASGRRQRPVPRIFPPIDAAHGQPSELSLCSRMRRCERSSAANLASPR